MSTPPAATELRTDGAKSVASTASVSNRRETQGGALAGLHARLPRASIDRSGARCADQLARSSPPEVAALFRAHVQIADASRSRSERIGCNPRITRDIQAPSRRQVLRVPRAQVATLAQGSNQKWQPARQQQSPIANE